ncbi:uncharacterized protein LOC100825456 [Brachypodium distachyon]|uniref:uncharacterized protein LOC100825456 n=1 Tax=Brachypodium distachyon TaxID=15368 RepID=UPI0001C7026D|nr:uncharacterized protein LOC100825456 [Brachypodium distachyon]|eukprot:XP_024310700.1 uncharacterized protein LOC100825456 [Brachypodium distachyon]
MRISMTDNTYRVINSPIVREGYPYLGVVRSEKGLYFVSLDNGWLKVWILNESRGEIGWMLKHEKYLKSMVAHVHQEYHSRFHGDWILEDINYNLFQNSSHIPKGLKGYDEDDDDVKNEDTKKTIVAENVDNVLGSGDEVEEYYWDVSILGFHPYKEIVFLTTDAVQTGFAYHLNSSKMEGLGNIYPRDYIYFKLITNEREKILSCFPYTPCWIDECLRNNWSTTSS